MFWDHKSLHQHLFRPEFDGKNFEANLKRGRTKDENKYFKRAMGGMQCIYFHAKADALIIEDVAPRAKNDTPYGKRGWTAMESIGICLSMRGVGLKFPEDGFRIGMYTGCVDSSFVECPVPMTLEDFKESLLQRKFLRDTDFDPVLKCYRDGFPDYVLHTRELFVDLSGGVGRSESGARACDGTKCRHLSNSLPHFINLQTLLLKGYCPPDRFHDRQTATPETEKLDRVLDDLIRKKGCRVFSCHWGTVAVCYPWPGVSVEDGETVAQWPGCVEPFRASNYVPLAAQDAAHSGLAAGVPIVSGCDGGDTW